MKRKCFQNLQDRRMILTVMIYKFIYVSKLYKWRKTEFSAEQYITLYSNCDYRSRSNGFVRLHNILHMKMLQL